MCTWLFSQDGGEVVFKIKMTTKFEKLMKAYCDRQNKRMDDMVFLFDGTRLRADQTPEDVRSSSMTLSLHCTRICFYGGRAQRMVVK